MGQPSAAVSEISLVSNAAYLPFGPLASLTFGNGRVQTRAFDLNYGIDAISDSGAANDVLFIDHDRAGLCNLAEIHELRAAQRVLRDVDNDGQNSYAADYFAFDARGRMHEHVEVVSLYPPTPTTQYDYNGRGERVWKQNNPPPGDSRGTPTQSFYLYDEGGQRIGAYRPHKTSLLEVEEEIVWVDSQPVASVRQEYVGSVANLIVRAIHTDHLNTPRALTALAGGSDPIGTTVWSWPLTTDKPTGNNAFGNELALDDPDGNGVKVTFDLRFPGQQFDGETGRHYNYFRDYEPGVGRYVESDPIGLGGGLSTYGYVGGNPLIYADSDGLYRRLFNEYNPAMSLCMMLGISCPPPQGPGPAGFYGGEGHFVVGGGLTSVTCIDECGKSRTFRYMKVCLGAAAGASASGGLVA